MVNRKFKTQMGTKARARRGALIVDHLRRLGRIWKPLGLPKEHVHFLWRYKTQRNRQKKGRGTSSGCVVHDQLLFGERPPSFFFWLIVEMDIGLMSVFVNEASNVSALSGKWLWRCRTQCKNQSTSRVDRRKSHSSALIEDQVYINFLESQHMSFLPAAEEE